MDLQTVLAAIRAVGTAAPEFRALVDAVKVGFGPHDQAQIDAAVASADAAADAAYRDSQSA